ncbi:SAYSvFN domain-containing protein 1 [Anopheles ziemanni]|uniref:SAYSvFN domain-containing protein 1 n=1 Tax=Anopheles coustani TaxID=139045 RepID=UPI00265AE9B7|nr:SAYSvFN domain-containing protein 1 [Anopheles coustani]XP_058173079.1 SAYSvFN domain-containing protein 1 [Anopheles ziemanni]
MESKLDSYRKVKRRQALLNDFKERIFNMVSFQQVRSDEKASHVIVVADDQSQTDETSPTKGSKVNVPPAAVHVKKLHIATSPNRNVSESEELDQTLEEIDQPEPEEKPRSFLTYVTYLVYFLFWATLYAIAIELRFGVVFLMLSALFGIYFNTRTKRAPGEISAYSVFNKNCEAIDGTLKAEQFEREIGIRH